MLMLSKQTQYAALVAARKACERCAASGLTHPARVQGGEFDSKEIGPLATVSFCGLAYTL